MFSRDRPTVCWIHVLPLKNSDWVRRSHGMSRLEFSLALPFTHGVVVLIEGPDPEADVHKVLAMIQASMATDAAWPVRAQ